MIGWKAHSNFRLNIRKAVPLTVKMFGNKINKSMVLLFLWGNLKLTKYFSLTNFNSFFSQTSFKNLFFSLAFFRIPKLFWMEALLLNLQP